MPSQGAGDNSPIDTEPHGISCTFVVPSPPATPNFATTFSSAQGQKPSKAAMGGSGLKNATN